MKTLRTMTLFSFLLVGSLLLASCGGGGGGGGGDNGTPPPPGPTGPTAPPTTAALKANDGSARASYGNMRSAFNNVGKGVMVWESQSGMDSRVIWAYFDGTNMQPESELAPSAQQPSVATNGTDFLLVWQNTNGGQVMVSSCSSTGLLGSPVSISGGTNGGPPDTAASLNGYAVTWQGYDTVSSQLRVYVNIYSASSWTVPKLVDTVNGAAYTPRIASNGSGYAITWQKYDLVSTYDIYAAVSSGATATATWSAPTALENLPGFALFSVIASNGIGYAVAWEQQGGGQYHIYAIVYSAGTWSNAGTLLESGSFSTAGGGDNVSIASNGSSYAVTWSQYDGVNNNIFTNMYSAGGWTAAQSVGNNGFGSRRPVIASNGAGYGVVWQQDESAGKYDVYANLYSAGTWSTPELIDTGTSSAEFPSVTRYLNGYAAAWHQDDAAGNPNIFSSMHVAGAWSAPPAQLVQGIWKGTAYRPAMATNQNGVSLAVWQEHHKGWRIVGSINTSGTWGAPFLVDSNTGTEVSVATNGTDFMLVWRGSSDQIYAASCSSSGVLGTPVAISGYSVNTPKIASNGTGYAAIWTDSHVYSNVYSAGSWSTGGSLIENNVYAIGIYSIASNGSGYAVAYKDNNNQVYTVLYTGGTWTAETRMDTGVSYAASPAIASDNSGYAVVWDQDGSIYARLYSSSTATWQNSPQPLENSVNTATSPAIASNGSGYAAVWLQQMGGVYSISANVFSSGTWSAGGTLLENSSGNSFSPSIASNGSGYAVSWTQHDGSYNSVYGNIYSAGTWSTGGTLIETNTGDADLTTIISNGNKYSVIWQQKDPADVMVYDVWARLGI